LEERHNGIVEVVGSIPIVSTIFRAGREKCPPRLADEGGLRRKLAFPFTMTKQSRTIVLTVIVTLFVVFVLQNLRSVSVRVIVWTPSVPLVVLLSLVFLAGGVAGWYWRKR
jgi:uncharacterized integral membrane protein